jgi:hypothetical protein
MPVAECEKEAPPVASIKQQKQKQQRGGENEIQNSTGESDSLQQNLNINVDCETESLLQNGDEMNFAKIKSLRHIEDILSMYFLEDPEEFELFKNRFYDFFPASSSSTLLLRLLQSKLLKENVVDVFFVKEEVGDEEILDRVILPSVNVKRDNRNDAHDDVDNKNNNGENEKVNKKKKKEYRQRSRLQNSSLTSKENSDHSSEIAMMMRMKSSKEFHHENFDHNDDEVGSSAAAKSSSPDLFFQSYVAGNGMIDDSETAHFTPSSSSGLDSLTSTELAIQKIIPTVAQRVKFRSIITSTKTTTSASTMGCCKNNNNNHPPQMEPMSTFVEEEIDSSSLIDDDEESTVTSSSVCNKKLPRFPIRCPLTNCDSYSIPSDFCNHITIDHPYIDILKVTPGKLTNMTINHKGNIDIVTCQRMFLVTDKIT